MEAEDGLIGRPPPLAIHLLQSIICFSARGKFRSGSSAFDGRSAQGEASAAWIDQPPGVIARKKAGDPVSTTLCVMTGMLACAGNQRRPKNERIAKMITISPTM